MVYLFFTKQRFLSESTMRQIPVHQLNRDTIFNLPRDMPRNPTLTETRPKIIGIRKTPGAGMLSGLMFRPETLAEARD